MSEGDARAYWVRAPGLGELRDVRLPPANPDEVLVRTLFSGISRGTEMLVFRGGVPADQHQAMRAPFQDGDFPGPVKYGYLNVGEVEEGPAHLVGRTVFCLYPHQTRYVVPADAVVVVPDDVPPARAALTGAVETAVNVLWDAPPLIGDRVTVVGAGMIGCCVARLLAKFPEVSVTLVDVDTSRAEVAAALGVEFAQAGDAPRDQDRVIHATATAEGLWLALQLLATEGEVIEVSWYGDTDVQVPLGGAFHSRRLAIRSSQVGLVAPVRRTSRTNTERRKLALELLRDPAFDALLSSRSPFDQLPETMAKLGSLPGLCHVITYEGSESSVQCDGA
ncbi:threonine dehydrogenase-like Zn-dependent dehydrogenase [Hoyosella altamirensis]|uniref:Threonine dehydrogenase-like Zn-dependent dehydrogenase n=2 Tax=Hoyosella altamirensis TaxID=616997 RepID=A0A839RHK5_9ACTN|nr:zinc-binding alcohol dehydrogenase [Hoyosella altamirensis]MBB3035718.1 threonine dehydrogenase-like Zn-dependent dehydrogenase [Hoyosella altamirensis]